MTQPIPSSTDLSEFVESVKRYVAIPGEFASFFPNTSDEDITGSLADAVGEAMLDGFFLPQSVMYGMPSGITYTLDTSAGTVTPGLLQSQVALIVLYASTAIVRSQLGNLQTVNKQTYKAGPVEYQTETGYASNVLTALLKTLTDRLTAIVNRLRTISAGSAFAMADGYFINAVGPYPGTWPYYWDGDIDRAYDYNQSPGV